MNLESMKQVTLAIAGAKASAEVLDRIVSGIAECKNVALARIWLIETEKDDRGSRSWLQLAASAGNLATTGVDARRLDGRFSRFEIGDRKIGRVAQSGEGIHLPDIEVDESWIADPAWAISEGIRAFAAQPLVARGEVLGVLGVFDRLHIPEEDFAWLRTFADHAAVAIANARDFEEIEGLRARLERENAYLRHEVAADHREMRGSSPAIEKLRRQIEMVAPTDAGVLVLGESGVGKELVAHAIHTASARAGRPLVRVNCGAIPDDLFESEFFGHVAGAFTGATRDRVGRFELADGGTLFLDEIGEIPLSQQVKLLRVLQEGSYERVGETEERSCDVRIIAATNRNLSDEVRAGRFRADLYYRLGVFPVEVAPLRDREDDVLELAEFFIERAAMKFGSGRPKISASGRRRLLNYDWPGNVRELQHLIERAVILLPAGPLPFEDLDQARPSREAEGPRRTAPARPLTTEELPSLAELRDLEREIIRRAWEKAARRVSGPSGAAQALGLPPSTLESKLRKFGLK
jgi:transcriptional regulator with GAF, ATPase, and Fis domain